MKNLIKPSTFCSIDASTNSLAFAYFVDDRLEKYGKIKYFGSDIYEKIVDTAHKTKIFFNQFDNLEYIVIEQPIYLNSPKTAANLAMSHGALVASAALSGVNHIHSVVPMVWQNAINNKRLTADEKTMIRNRTPGKSESWYKSQERLFRKQRTISYVNNRFGTSIADDDVSDACAIGAYALDNPGKVFQTMAKNLGLHHSEAYLRKRLLLDKKSPEDIAKECGVSLQIIYKQLKKFGLK